MSYTIRTVGENQMYVWENATSWGLTDDSNKARIFGDSITALRRCNSYNMQSDEKFVVVDGDLENELRNMFGKDTLTIRKKLKS